MVTARPGSAASASAEKSVDETNATLLADKDAQAQIVAFGPLDIFQLAQTVGDAGRDAFDIEGIGGVGAGAFCAIQQGGKDFFGVAFGGHVSPMPHLGLRVKVSPPYVSWHVCVGEAAGAT